MLKDNRKLKSLERKLSAGTSNGFDQSFENGLNHMSLKESSNLSLSTVEEKMNSTELNCTDKSINNAVNGSLKVTPIKSRPFILQVHEDNVTDKEAITALAEVYIALFSGENTTFYFLLSKY